MWPQFRAAIRLQVIVTAAAALLAGWLGGVHSAISASAGGLIGIAGGLAFALFASRSKSKSAGEVLVDALRAEAAKLTLGIVLLLTVLVAYRNVVALSLIGSFVASMLIFGIAAFAANTTTEQKG